MSLLRLLYERSRMVLFSILIAALGLLWNWPHDFSSWMLLLCWLLGVTSFLFIARAYLAPYVLMRFSSHVRVRSVSLRSIRGLYFRKGNRTWQIDRLGYSYSSSADGKPKGLFFQIEGLNLRIESPADTRPTAPRSKHRRGLTLADLSPSPLALYLWSIMSDLYSYFDPVLRPIIRLLVTYVLSQVIHSIPRLTETVQMELDKAVVLFDVNPEVRVVVENAVLKGHVSFIRNSKYSLIGDHTVSQDHTLSARALAMGAWKSRLAKGFQRTWTRTWDRTLGQTTGSVAFDLTIQGVKGLTPQSSLFLASALHDQPAMRCSQALVASGSARFSPRNGSVEPGSLYTQTSLGVLHVNVDVLQTFLPQITAENLPIPPSTAAQRSPAISPWLRSPFSTPSLSSTFSAPHVEKRTKQSVMPIELVASAGFSLRSFTLSKMVDENNHNVIIQDLACSCQSGDTDENATHREWLGRQPFSSSSGPYSFSFAFQGISVERSNNIAHSSFRVLHIGSTSIESVVVECLGVPPVNTSFRGDPNAPCIFLDFKVASISFADRLDVLLQHLKKPSTSKQALSQDSDSVLPSILSPIPRLVFNAAVGHLSVRLICADASMIEEPFAVEMETDGINWTSSSNFRTGPTATLDNLDPLKLEGLPLHMTLSFNCLLHPFFVRLRSTCATTVNTVAKRMSKWGTEAVNGDTLFSLEEVEANGALTALGEINDDDPFSATLETSSMFVDLHCRTEATLLELWDPERLKILKMLVRFLLPYGNSFTPGPARARTPSIGYVLSFSVARSVLFITAPDINPDADPEITRGVALGTGISLRYCAGELKRNGVVPLPYSQSHHRQKLCLPVDRRRDATTSTKASEAGKGGEAYGKVTFWNTTVRSAAADKFSMDDPQSTERDSPLLENRQLLVIKSSELDFRLRSQIFSTLKGPAYDATFSIDDAELSFELSLIYSTLLAVRTIQAMWQSPRQTSVPPSRPNLAIRGTIKAVRMRLNLPGQEVVARANHLDILFIEDRIQCTINSFLVWVLVLSLQKHSLGGMPKKRWEEIGRLHRCTVSKVITFRDQVKVDSDSLRIRIPSGYVVADLQHAVVVTLKAVRHMIKMVTVGRFTQMPAPAAEAPKIVPSVMFTCRMLCMEAADDPFESQLGLNHKIGLEAAKARVRREDAFDAKVSAVMSGNPAASSAPFIHADYRFDGQHAIPVQEARWRLDMTHTLDWLLRYQQRRRERVAEEELVYKELYGNIPLKRPTKAPDLVKTTDWHHVPPLLRISVFGFRLHLNHQSFPLEHLPDFLYEQGNGLPHKTRYSLLIPMHLNISLASLQVTLRDYPLPLLCIPVGSGGSESPSLLFDSDLVVAEEMGPLQSVEWITCSFASLGEPCVDSTPVSLLIPKTIMPVKTYARPSIQVLTDQITAFAWGVSYGPAIQDVVKVLEGLSPESRDPSPQIGFWDKLRLIFHWRVEISFKQEVRLYLKGTRDPYVLENEGAGFALCWQGVPAVRIGFANDNQELVQVTSDTMSVIIPRFPGGAQARRDFVSRSDCLKSCAKLTSGVLFGVGVAFERTCDAECKTCTGSPFDRGCRLFTFRPHYDVQLVTKTSTSKVQDSYRGFRSDFIHLSISITSALQQGASGSEPQPSSFHLTPRAFASFWSWWGLFDNGMSLPIRQGSYFPRKSNSPKFSRHLATIKYKVTIPQLFISHAYINDTRECWVEGITTVVGVKAKVDHFQADLHQRDQETVTPGKIPNSVQVIRHKPFYAAEVVMKNLDLRTMRAVFLDPLKKAVPMSTDSESGMKDNLPLSAEISPLWFDPDDFVETDWSSQNYPEIQLFPTLSCPKLTYFKKNLPTADTHIEHSKFGDEDTHACLLGSEFSVPQVEISLAEQRIATLEQMAEGESESPESTQRHPMSKMMFLLREYITHLRAADASPKGLRTSNVENYYMPSDIVSADEWTDFENVYQVHSPNLFMSNPIRDILMQYYNCSRARLGYEYHMATRAVKFIRDQAEAMISGSADETAAKPRSSGTAAQVAATALRKILNLEHSGASLDIQAGIVSDPVHVNPLDGWEDGVILRKRHFCLLLKPQIILRSIEPPSETALESTAILAAVQAKLQSFKIMDARNLEDPVSGNIMTRNYTSLDGLQTFCPTTTDSSGDGSVPLEVLIDYRCESDSFDRIVPQTNATCQYDRFNRLRLRNNVTSTARSEGAPPRRGGQAHLYNETDLVQLHIPRFTVSASDSHFQSISDIIANLVLFSDVAHKARLEKLETLLFAYDFSDLDSAANVVSDLQNRLRSAIETHSDVSRQVRTDRSRTNLEILKLKAHMFLLVEELNLIFDAIRLAQDRTDDRTDQKSALLLHASSSEISWRMLDEHRELLAKLAVRNIYFSWLSKRDSSTANSLTVGDLQVFDGSPHAVWTEIVSKYEEPSNHPLFKRDLFLDAEWTILAPVGGITIYEKFLLDFHPIRLQLDARLGQRIMEYVWPARRGRNHTKMYSGEFTADSQVLPLAPKQAPLRSSLDSSRLLQKPRTSLDSSSLAFSTRKLATSQSFTDLRSAATESMKGSPSLSSNQRLIAADPDTNEGLRTPRKTYREDRPGKDDAVEMKTRSSQKTFILVKISSLELLLSIMKAESFECRDARIRTHALEFRNQTWSFEELVDQFIPTDLTWKGWVRMAFHQPLVPVLPVARELFSKTKLVAFKGATHLDPRPAAKKPSFRRGRTTTEDTVRERRPRKVSPSNGALSEHPASNMTGAAFVDEPEALEGELSTNDVGGNRHPTRTRLLSIFNRDKPRPSAQSLLPNVERLSSTEPTGG